MSFKQIEKLNLPNESIYETPSDYLPKGHILSSLDPLTAFYVDPCYPYNSTFSKAHVEVEVRSYVSGATICYQWL